MPLSDSPPTAAERNSQLALQRLRGLSRVLDNAIAIPGIGYRVGLDPLIGLLPGGGDLVAGIISIYVVAEAARLGVPAATLGRMGFNILTEVVIGTVPMVGDLFDVVWKANARNVALLERHLHQPIPSRRTDKLFAIVLIAGLLIIVIGVATLSLLFVRWVFQL
ncbi:hypothetical protein N836_35030 [Leptolyngbya sp. Heron Island J]|uniref:DUF4112 domain-containing protein n=1 Tax=Leptolyngbya sp. Heron Island J TaxID=1385935 RepID=UPI0003B98C1C|nr:DUF4112 domain-containing protein [Leptolyngbya sp. Heron Island J]ESA37838.1 hypothetical protein N836_35030 [Leptolyngbya sp. Heron Island J]